MLAHPALAALARPLPAAPGAGAGPGLPVDAPPLPAADT
jgi:hypothetical protein